MTVGDDVRAALDHWSAREWTESVARACDAVAGTATKRYPDLGKAARFTRTVRSGVDIFGAMAAADIDFATSRLPVPVDSRLPGGKPDIADVLYAVHRYLDGEHSAIPGGCVVTAPVETVPMFHIHRGHLRMRASAALGLLAVAVLAPENKGESIGGSYTLGWRQHVFHIIGWWGWQDHFREILTTNEVEPQELDFGPEWAHWESVR